MRSPSILQHIGFGLSLTVNRTANPPKAMHKSSLRQRHAHTRSESMEAQASESSSSQDHSALDKPEPVETMTNEELERLVNGTEKGHEWWLARMKRRRDERVERLKQAHRSGQVTIKQDPEEYLARQKQRERERVRREHDNGCAKAIEDYTESIDRIRSCVLGKHTDPDERSEILLTLLETRERILSGKLRVQAERLKRGLDFYNSYY